MKARRVPVDHWTGRRIRRLRARRRWTQEQLAREVGVAVVTVARWEIEWSHPSQLARSRLTTLEGG